ncbi:MAG TPA: hypothetical protein VGQ81_02130 [Acidobacteriota bacterium]|jgi:hypothetical protein|nr:hypothetical protein [Acidobacteriota bacterium]
MDKTNFSLWYVVAYLVPTGAVLMVAPDVMLRILLSSGDYGDVFPRLVGCFMVGLGVFVLQIIRHRVRALYPTTLGARIFFCASFLALYFRSRDPFFLVISCVVAVGLAMTAATYFLDRRSNAA